MTLRDRLTGAAATLLILVLLVGTPWLLLHTSGNPFPTRLPTAADVGGWLTRPDDGTLALAAIRDLAWIAWLILAVLLAVEIVAAARGRTAPRLPGLRVPQQALGRLVATAALLFLTVPVLASAATLAWADPTSPATTVPAEPTGPATTVPAEPTTPHSTTAAHAAHAAATAAAAPVVYVEHVVGSGDTLSGLAERYLGDPDEWGQIFAASTGIEQPEGQRLTDPDLILPGWTLRIPTDGIPAAAAGYTRHRVARGDTLSGLAQTYLGDADQWPQIYAASTAVAQPGGRHLTNPNLILPGWTLHIPTHPTPAATDSPTAAPVTPVAPSSTPPPTVALPPTASAPSIPIRATTPTASQQPPADTPAAAIPEPTVTTPAAGMAAPWLLTGFTIGGAVLAGSALMVLRHRRQQRLRLRAPGAPVAAPAARLAPVEKTIRVVGSVAAPTIDVLDQALRQLAADRTRTQQPMPALDRVELGDYGLLAFFAESTRLEAPWQADDDTGHRWRLATSSTTDPVGPDQPAPYPLLVSCGARQDGQIVLLNLEQVGTLTVTGDPDYSRDFLRYLAAELAVNPWSRDVTITCQGVADELTAMNPTRFRPIGALDQATARLHQEAAATSTRQQQVGTDIVTARTRHLADEAWGAQVLIADDNAAHDHEVQRLIDLLADQPGTTATAILLAQPDAPTGTVAHLTPHGRLLIPTADLDLVAVGLIHDEARGCAALLAQADTTDETDLPAPTDSTTGSSPAAAEADAGEAALTLPEDPEPADPAHAAQLASAAAGPRPGVGTRQREAASTEEREPLDASLDEDVRDWFAADCDRPRLALLGPVGVRAHGVPIAKRKPFFIEVLAYLALHEHGATADEMAADFGYTTSTIRTSVKTVRDWLGTNPRTGERHVPDATSSRAAAQRGLPVYQVDDLLVDVDLFRRLRVRSRTRPGHRTADLVTALRLVTGRPFSQLRPSGWSWLVDLNTEHHLVCAIIDVAHDLTEHFLATGDLPRARAATETALLAAPYDAMTRIDLATITQQEGHPDEARQIVEDVYREPDEDGLPHDLTQQLAELAADLGARRAS